jgi:hypothetical protein
VTYLITALRIAATETAEAHGIKECPALAAFHVGITRVEGNALRGAAVIRALELTRENLHWRGPARQTQRFGKAPSRSAHMSHPG